MSAGDVVEYLKEFSKDLTSEVKFEIREACNAVDEFISPDCFHGSRRSSPPHIVDKWNPKLYKSK